MYNIKKPIMLKNLLTSMSFGEFLFIQIQGRMLSFFSKNRLLYINYPQFSKSNNGDIKF